jgi:hypothetical protein
MTSNRTTAMCVEHQIKVQQLNSIGSPVPALEVVQESADNIDACLGHQMAVAKHWQVRRCLVNNDWLPLACKSQCTAHMQILIWRCISLPSKRDGE